MVFNAGKTHLSKPLRVKLSEHRLFSFISSHWRGEPFCDDETIVRLIAKTTTAHLGCRLDRRRYPVGHKVSDAEIDTVQLTPDGFHGEWNHAIRPRAPG